MLLGVERYQATHHSDAGERVEEEPLVFEGAAPRLYHGVRDLQLREGQRPAEHASGDMASTSAFTCSTPESANTTGVVSEEAVRRLASSSIATLLARGERAGDPRFAADRGPLRAIQGVA